MDAGVIVGAIATVMEIVAFLLVARALVSWFPDLQRHQIVQLLFEITDPILEPLRKLIPPVGRFDFTIMITVFTLFIVAESLRASV